VRNGAEEEVTLMLVRSLFEALSISLLTTRMIAPSELLPSEGVTGEFEVWNEDRCITI
jgi:hypothetical protein